ncbi:glucose-6-phosphate isomerase family protein [Actinoallomurus oryzae]|uniref:glucose-6-phosphate isomerase family protein n=1 Tax=Actinoallomurus oryzae TaxID=502180 RepID=UPI0031EA424F
MVEEGYTVPPFATPPVPPMHVGFDDRSGGMSPSGPVLVRRMSDLRGLYADQAAWTAALESDDVVYEVASSPVPELEGELPQSITTILPGRVGGEFHMTKGHMHTRPRGEIYLGLSGLGGLLLFDGERPQWIEMRPGSIGYIPPHWAHRSVNVGDEPYRFLAVYPGDSGHDYGWVAEHGMGHRVFHGSGGPELRPFTFPAG